MTQPRHRKPEPTCHDLEDCQLTPDHVRAQLDEAATDLLRRYGSDTFSRETVRRYLQESYDLLAATARVHAHLPILAARFARERLASIAKIEGVTVSDRPEVLFVCVHNAGRSQMAAALLDHHAAGRVTVRSAGSAPADDGQPGRGRGHGRDSASTSPREFPKPLTDDGVRAADVVITMGCGDACPVYPRQALPQLGTRRPGRQDRRGHPSDPRRHRRPGHGPAR